MWTLVTAMTARRPADTRSRAQCGAPDALLTTTDAPDSAAASTMPSRASATYDLRLPLNCTSIVGLSTASLWRNTGAK